jgi:LysM repeat protein
MGVPTRTAGFVIGAVLLAFACAIGFQPAWAGPAPKSNQLPAINVQSPSQPQAEAAVPPKKPRVYLFRGALGPIFSTGMDRLAERLEAAGIWARVYEFTLCQWITHNVADDYRESGGAPIVFIGHSMGGLCSLKASGWLAEEHIPVSLVVTIDPAHASPSVPLNVERFINIFLSTSVLGGGDIMAEPGYRGHYASFDMKDHPEVTHINIDKADYTHTQLVNMITQLPTVPAMSEGEPLPLRYVVPPQAQLELWDSGTPLSARPGDTLDKLAAAYRIPVWSLVQANNKLSENSPLVPGERIVIPRHLMPATTMSAQASSPQPLR